MADVNLGEIAQGFLPSASTVYVLMIWIVGIIAFALLIGVGTWIIIDQRRYARKIPIYENQNGVLKQIGMDKARIITIDKGLAKIWYLKKLKIPSQVLTLSSARNTFPVIRKSDGDLVNFELKLDESGKQVIGKVLSTGIRMANANMRRYFRSIYHDEGVWAKYGKTILYLVEMVVFFVILVYILSDVAKLIPQLNSIATNLANALNQVKCSPVNLGVVQ